MNPKKDKEDIERLRAIPLGTAPPPEETKEIDMRHIKEKLKAYGLDEYIDRLKGPKTIKVSTHPQDIHKMFLHEEHG